MLMHPFSPAPIRQGFDATLHELEQHLVHLTGMAACSLQPCSGAAGEYAGLCAIREYQQSIGQGHRNVCIIPKSAHGTNPASAAMAGMRVVWINDAGGIDLGKLKA